MDCVPGQQFFFERIRGSLVVSTVLFIRYLYKLAGDRLIPCVKGWLPSQPTVCTIKSVLPNGMTIIRFLVECSLYPGKQSTCCHSHLNGSMIGHA